MGLSQETSCLVCGDAEETRNHLFFACSFSQACLSNSLNRVQIKVQTQDIQGMWTRMSRRGQGKISRATLWAVLAADIYHIWMARNDSL